MDGKYINLQTDFGFKKIFGSDCNKDLLISLLKALIPERQDIKDIKYLNTEYQGDTFVDRRAIFDVYCESEAGDHFIVEMQNASQAYFKDRSVFYSTFPIRNQAPKGYWDFKLSNVYTIGLLNFEMDDDSADPDEVRHEVKLMNTRTKRVFYDKLTLIYVIIPRFRKTEGQLESLFDKWMFVLKNMSELMSRPERLQERVFKRLFQAAEIAAYSPEELNCYFIELGQKLGAERLAAAAKAFGLGQSITLAPGLQSDAASLPGAAQLQNAGDLALFSFGQGALTATPLQIAAMTAICSCSGVAGLSG
mgnify:CR=1 FL=1